MFTPTRSQLSDLAARLTDLALQALSNFGPIGNSIDAEIKLWHALRSELEFVFLGSRLRTGETQGNVLREAIRTAVDRVADDMHVVERRGRRTEPSLVLV